MNRESAMLSRTDETLERFRKGAAHTQLYFTVCSKRKDACSSEPRDEMLEKSKASFVGPMEVFEKEYQRLLLTRAL